VRLVEEQEQIGGKRLEHVETNGRARRGRRGAEPRRNFLRNVTVAFASAAVVALLVGYALAAPTPELTVRVGHVVPQPGEAAVVQGRVVEPDARGLRGLRVEVRRGREVSAAVSDRTGRFRVDLAGGCGTYEITLAGRWRGSALEGDARRRLCPGDALPIQARIVTQGHFLWVPGPR
jgi:hypothetical protein